MNYSVTKNGIKIKTRSCKIFPRPYNSEKYMEYIMLPMGKRANIEIHSKIKIESAVVRPASRHIPFTLQGGRLFITLDQPQTLSVEINGGSDDNLMIFAYDEKREEPPAKAEHMITVAKGTKYTGKLIITEDNTTVYIEDGAVIAGNIYAEKCKNLTICGFGRICMEDYTYEMRKDYARSIDLYKCENVKIRDIIIDDSNDWSLRVNGCKNVDIDSVKIFGCRGNSDGIDVCGSKNVTVSNIFTRVWDDSFVVKALDTGNAENILFKDSVLWNDFARPIEVGVELRADKVKNVRFENIDILHSTTGYPVMGIHHGDRAEVSDIEFKNIRIEDAPGSQLFDIRITNSVWNRDSKMGRIHDISFSDISYDGANDNGVLLSNSRLQGFDAEHDIQNVSFKNITIGGRAVKTAEELALDICENVKNVSVSFDGENGELLQLDSEVGVRGGFETNADGTYTGTVYVRLSNNTDGRISGTASLAVSPKNTETERAFEYDVLPGESKEFDFKMRLLPGRYIFFTKDEKRGIKNAWTFKAFDAIIQEGADIKTAPEYGFVNYYGTREASVRFAANGGFLEIMPDITAQAVLYTAMPAEMQPGEVVFSAEETDFGEVCAVVEKDGGLAAAPQLRCPAEITYVFKNEPKVRIKKTKLVLKKGEPARISMKELGISGNEFLLELAVSTHGTRGLRYPYTLFHSTAPDTTAHMYCRFRVAEK